MRAKLDDLRAARFQDASLSVDLLSSQYTPPERFDVPTLPKSTKTDMYSIGVTICELFTSLFPDREQRMDQVLLIRQIDVCALCKHLMRDDDAPACHPRSSREKYVLSRTDDERSTSSCKKDS